MLQANYDELENRHEATKREIAELRSQLQAEKTRGEELWEELGETEEALAEVRAEKSDLQKTCDELRSELSDLKQKSAPGVELPEAATIYNHFKAQNPKTKTTYKEVMDILARVQAMIEES